MTEKTCAEAFSGLFVFRLVSHCLPVEDFEHVGRIVSRHQFLCPAFQIPLQPGIHMNAAIRIRMGALPEAFRGHVADQGRTRRRSDRAHRHGS